jgi:alpha-1,6-mannosyltransferase
MTMRPSPHARDWWQATVWLSLAIGLVGWAVALTLFSGRFGYDVEVIDMPIPALIGLLLCAGLSFAGVLVRLLSRRVPAGPLVSERQLLTLIIVAGLAARAVCFFSEPILEDDYQRYLWDGAVTARGTNPYRHAPADVLENEAAHPLAAIAAQAGVVLQRIGHSDLTTIYPPIAQAAFAIAHRLTPFSLVGWRGLLLLADLAALALLLRLLTEMGRPQVWVAIYWWNPLVIKQVFNAAHMDALLVPLLLTAVLFAQRRPLLATSAIGLAVGVKFWPAMLLPLLWRPHVSNPRLLMKMIAVFAPFAALAVLPQFLTGLDREAGVVAYATSWSRNSALFPVVEGAVSVLAGAERAQVWARAIIAATMLLLVARMAWPPLQSRDDLVRRIVMAIGALLLLSPAQYPWYAVWIAPFLALWPVYGFLLLPVTMSLYELYFYCAARDVAFMFSSYVVWLVWLPVWATLLLVDAPAMRTRERAG